MYVSTQKIGKEKGRPFNGLPGIRHWMNLQKTASLDAEGIGLIRTFMLDRLSLQLDLAAADDPRRTKKRKGLQKQQEQKPSVLVNPKLPAKDLEQVRKWLQSSPSKAEMLVKQFW